MKYKIVENVQTFKDYLDGKIEESKIHVVDILEGNVIGLPELMAADVLDQDYVFLSLNCEE